MRFRQDLIGLSVCRITRVMTSKPVNLRQFRKRKQREDKARQAEANRVEHGTPKALREPVQLERQRLLRELEARKLAADDKDGETPSTEN